MQHCQNIKTILQMLESEPDDNQGFHPQCLEFQEFARTKQTIYKCTQSPAKELDAQSRPKGITPRVFKATIPMKKLPRDLISPSIFPYPSETLTQFNKYESDRSHRSKFNGNGKLLVEVFQKPQYTCIYDKNHSQQRHPDQLSSRKRRLSSPYDYNSKAFTQLVEPETNHRTEVRFDSAFQCGNLSQVYKGQTPNQYYFLLEDDTNTRGYNQWFFFSVSNLPTTNILFNIVNMNKKSSLYSRGFQISVWTENRGWHKAGDNIWYYNARIKRKYRPDENYYCLSFDYTPEHKKSIVFFALNQPYPFSRLINLLDETRKITLPSSISMIQKTIGYTHSNNAILALQTTSPSLKPQKIVLVLARQHPGQTVSSFVCQGFIQQLVKSTPETMYLLKRYTFVILPMLNPDGVIYGHSRCNMAGLDINRQWGQSALKELNPETYYVWKYIRELQQNAEIVFVIDLHSHSKKTGCFLYGCRLQNSSQTKLFGGILSRIQHTFVNSSCRYGQELDKQNTIRCQLYKEVRKNCFTLEASFYGWKNKGEIQHYNQTTLKQIGKSLVRSLFISFAPEETAYKIEGTSSNRIRSTMALTSERFVDIESASEKSQSQPDADNIPEQQYTQIFGIPKSQLISTAFIQRDFKVRPKPSHPLKLKALRRRKKLSTVPSIPIQPQKSQPLNSEFFATEVPQRPQIINKKKSAELLFTRTRNNLTLKQGIPNLRLTLIANSDKVQREMFTSLEIIRRQRQLIAVDSKRQPQQRDSFRKQASSYINYKVYKRRLNMSVSTSSKPNKLAPPEQASKLLKTIQYLSPERQQPTHIGAYDFPIF